MTRLMLLCACAALVLTPLAASVAEPVLSPSRSGLDTAPLRTASIDAPVVAQPATPQAQTQGQPACARKVRVVGAGYGEPVLPACRGEASAPLR